MKREIWKVVPSLPDYLASSHGRIKRIPHEKPMPYGGVRRYGGHAWRGVWSENRYILIYKRRTYRVARLICEAFKGPPPFKRAVAMHLDENSRHNMPGNLQWGTQKQNLNAPGFLTYCRGRTGENSPTIKGRAKGLTANRALRYG